jgi:hypothetical protein
MGSPVPVIFDDRRCAMASIYYCSSAAGELEVWSQRLHELSSEIERIPSIDKYKLQPQIDALHIITIELDDRLCDLMNSCESIETLDSVDETDSQGARHNFTESKNERFDYDFGG